MKGLLLFVLVSTLALFIAARNLPGSRRTYGNFVPDLHPTFRILESGNINKLNLKSGDTVQAALEFFVKQAKVGRNDVQISSYHTSEHNGVTHLYLQQTLNGIRVANGVANLNILKTGAVKSIGNSFYAGPKPSATVQATKYNAVDAVRAVANFLRIEISSSLTELENEDLGSNDIRVKGVEFVHGDVPVELNYIQVENGQGIKLVWSMKLDMADNYYKAYVDVESNQVVSLIDYVSDASYNVQRFRLNDPRDGPREIVNDPADPVASRLGWHSSGSFESYSSTIGNNVFAQENLDADFEYIDDIRPHGGEDLVFDVPLNLGVEPWEESNTNASTVQLFYMTNIIHDVFYKYGFNEAAGNFQEYNFDLGGDGSDAVIANAQDGEDFDNANFRTLPDGENGRMRMYLFRNLTEDGLHTDGVFESGIVVHEYLHGISNRLTGGRLNVECLPEGESGGMGEGWGDIFGVMFIMDETLNRDKMFTMGDYVIGEGSGGIRIHPYSTSMTINPSTYRHVLEEDYDGVHSKGQIWAGILYEILWNLIEKHGFQADWYKTVPGEDEQLGGNVIFAQLLIDGMKLQPCSPNFIQARDAIIQADEINNNGDNFNELWFGFAKRGLGLKAEFPGIEDYEVPERTTGTTTPETSSGAETSAFQTYLILAAAVVGLVRNFQ